MIGPGKRAAVPGMCAARLRTRARRQRSHRETPILSLASTALGQSPSGVFDTLQSSVPCRQYITHINTCIYTHHQLNPILLPHCGYVHILQVNEKSDIITSQLTHSEVPL